MDNESQFEKIIISIIILKLKTENSSIKDPKLKKILRNKERKSVGNVRRACDI